MHAEINGIKLHYLHRESASPRRPVMLITGLGGDGRAWGPQIDLFAAEGEVIVPDHRGTGRSTGGVDGQTISQHADDMAELVRQVGAGAVHVVGSSTGGAIAQVMALKHPDTVASLCLVASWGRADAYFRTWFQLRRRVLTTMSRGEHVDLTQLLLHSADFWQHHRDVIDRERSAMMSSSGAVAIADARMEMLLDHDVIEQLASLTLPSIVAVGELDVVCPPYLSRQLADAIPRSELELFPGAGHYLHVEVPGQFHRRVSHFIDAAERQRTQQHTTGAMA